MHTSCCLDYLAVSWYQLIAPVKSFSVVDVIKRNKTASPFRDQYALNTTIFVKRRKQRANIEAVGHGACFMPSNLIFVLEKKKKKQCPSYWVILNIQNVLKSI